MQEELQFKRETIYGLAFIATLKNYDLSSENFSKAMKSNIDIVRNKLYSAHVQWLKEREASGEWKPTTEIID